MVQGKGSSRYKGPEEGTVRRQAGRAVGDGVRRMEKLWV